MARAHEIAPCVLARPYEIARRLIGDVWHCDRHEVPDAQKARQTLSISGIALSAPIGG